MICFNIEAQFTYTIYVTNLEYKKGGNGGWCVLAMPPEFDGVYDSLLETLLINNEILIYLIKCTDHTESNYVKLVSKIH